MDPTKSIKNFSIALLKAMSIPVILYGSFFIIRVKGFQPPAEAELGEFITATYFIFGASISYFVFVLYGTGRLPASPKKEIWWWSLSCFLLLLAFDETYKIHENVAILLKTREVMVFLVYGMTLCVLVFINRHQITKPFVFFFFGFVILSGIAVVADFLFREGLINILGMEVDYEQLCESLAGLSLSGGFVAMAMEELRALKPEFRRP